MNTKLLYAMMATATVGALIFWSCQKTGRFQNPEKNVSLVPLDTAKMIAEHFDPNVFFNTANPENHSPFTLTLHGGNSIKNEYTIKDTYGNPAIYVFNFTHDQGFLFVSADYGLRPVLAYFERGEFKRSAAPAGLVMWLNTTVSHVEAVRTGRYDNARSGSTGWKRFDPENSGQGNNGSSSVTTDRALPPPPPCTPSSTTTTVGPLLPVTWGQDCSYNDDCPNLNCNDCSPLAVTGCVATAVAQVVRYWSPTNGAYTYNYGAMPAATGSPEVARLMHDAGVQVGMSYGCAANGGSSADDSRGPDALHGSFGLSSGGSYSSYNGDYATVQSNIAAHWPVLLGGCNNQSSSWIFWYTYSNCHEWVCDGYQQIDETSCVNGSPYTIGYLYFHMNWGWHETNTANDFNGWFAFDNWNIPGGGPNGTDMNFQYAQDMTTSIHP